MSIDFNKPVKTDNYDTGLLSSIRAHVVALACQLDPSDAGTITSPPTGARRWIAGSVPERYSGSSWVEMSTGFLKATAPATYGSVAIAGSLGSYFGVQFSSSAKKWTFMVDAAGLSGLYSVTDSAWKWCWDASGILTAGTVPWARLSGVPAVAGETAATTATALTLAKRDAGNNLLAGYFNQGSGLETPAIGAVFVQNTAADGFLRKISLANFNTAISPAWANVTGRPTAVSAFTNDSGFTPSASAPVFTGQVRGNSGSKGLGAITVTTTATPSGGSDGDFWLVY
jgi:hypothetical protein